MIVDTCIRLVSTLDPLPPEFPAIVEPKQRQSGYLSPLCLRSKMTRIFSSRYCVSDWKGPIREFPSLPFWVQRKTHASKYSRSDTGKWVVFSAAAAAAPLAIMSAQPATPNKIRIKTYWIFSLAAKIAAAAKEKNHGYDG
jgi:hypothetical protein